MPTLPAPVPAAPADPVPAPAPAVPLGDVPALLHGSRPRSLLRPTGRALFFVWMAVLVGPLLGLNAPALEVMALLATAAGVAVMAGLGAALRRETNAVGQLEELIALHRVPEAAPRLATLMSRPMRAPENRLRSMLLLGGVLSRLGRPADAITVYDELLDAERLGGPGGAMVRLARAGAMLVDNRLYDADRAINELRRLLDRGGVAAEMRSADVSRADAALAGSPDPTALAGLRLLELHRDVKTNHLTEAVEHFDAQLPLLRQGLGHRVADAHALVAIALHRLGRPDEARARYADATALAPLPELVRRYVDLWPLTQHYAATVAPR